jgi:NADH:ubiquinone oxidoreductase subunit C
MTYEQLKEKINSISDKLIKVEQTSPKRLYLLCESENAYKVNRFVFEDLKARFVVATGIDSDNCYEIIYHFSYDQLGTFLNVKAFIRDRNNPHIESITPFIPGAEWTEREIHDILGVEFKNHPNMKKLILADNWPDGKHPIKKDYEYKKLK